MTKEVPNAKKRIAILFITNSTSSRKEVIWLLFTVCTDQAEYAAVAFSMKSDLLSFQWNSLVAFSETSYRLRKSVKASYGKIEMKFLRD